MSKPKDPVDEDDDILPEYDFSNGVRGKYYKPGRSPIRVTIENDVARYYLASKSERRSYMDEEQMIYDEPMEPGDEETTHFDWSKAVRGLHCIPWVKGTATLDEDVYSIFRTSEEVNNALRMLIREGRIPHFPRRRQTPEFTEESTSPPALPARRGGARRR